MWIVLLKVTQPWYMCVLWHDIDDMLWLLEATLFTILSKGGIHVYGFVYHYLYQLWAN